MSLICLCITDIDNQQDLLFYQYKLKNIAEQHKRGVSFSVDWYEPLVEELKNNYVVINLSDSEVSDNCEKLLMPDGWQYGDRVNEYGFRERTKFLYDIADTLLEGSHKAEFYIGLSGTNHDEYCTKVVNQANFIDALANTVGCDENFDLYAFHIVVLK